MKRPKAVKLKEPKTFKRPRLYYQIGRGYKHGSVLGERVRIIYPNGKIEYLTLAHPGVSIPGLVWRKSCFQQGIIDGKDTLKIMRQYDALYKFPKAVFLGEL